MPAVPAIIMAGAAIYGAHKASSANNKATETQAASDDKALEVLKEQYDLERSDNSGYRAIGQGGLGNLAYLSGIDLEAEKAKANPDLTAAEGVRHSVEDQARAVMNQNQPATGFKANAAAAGFEFPKVGRLSPWSNPASLSAYGPTNPSGFQGQVVNNLTQGGMVRVQAPNGQVGMIPASQLQRALANGGKEVTS